MLFPRGGREAVVGRSWGGREGVVRRSYRCATLYQFRVYLYEWHACDRIFTTDELERESGWLLLCPQFDPNNYAENITEAAQGQPLHIKGL